MCRHIFTLERIAWGIKGNGVFWNKFKNSDSRGFPATSLGMCIYFEVTYERRVVNLHKRLITPLGKKWPWPAGLSLKKHHSALLVAYLERPNCTPRALIGAFSGSTVTIKLVSTGPNSRPFQKGCVTNPIHASTHNPTTFLVIISPPMRLDATPKVPQPYSARHNRLILLLYLTLPL